MKQTVLNLILSLHIGVVLVFLGCGTGAKRGTESTTNVGTLVVSSETNISPPSTESVSDPGGSGVYILEPYPDGTRGFLYTIGIGESQDLSIARSMAIQRARAAMAQKAQVLVAALSKDFQQQSRTDAKVKINAVFTQVSESIAAATLNGTTVVKTEATEKGGLYSIQVMLGLPIKSNISEPLDAQIGQDDALYQAYQAWKGPNGLEEKIGNLDNQ